MLFFIVGASLMFCGIVPRALRKVEENNRDQSLITAITADPKVYREVLKLDHRFMRFEKKYKTELNTNDVERHLSQLGQTEDTTKQDARMLYNKFMYRYYDDQKAFRKTLAKKKHILVEQDIQKLTTRASYPLEIEKLVDQDVLSAYCTPRQEQINKEKEIHNQMAQAKAKDGKADLTEYQEQLCNLYEANTKDDLEAKLTNIKNDIKNKLNKIDVKEKNKDHIINRYTNTLQIFPNSDERKKHFNANLKSYQELQKSVQK